jgi:hypothetical protein
LGYTGSGATGVNWTNKSTTYTAVNNDGIIANTSGGSFTVTLPASPSTGSYVVFLDGNSSFATYPLTVDGNGNNIADSYSTATLNITNSKVEFIYNGSTWEIATSTGTRGYSGSVGYTGSLGYTGSQGYTGSASTVIGYTGSKGDIGYTGSIPAAITATSLALGGATLGTNNLAVTGTSAFSSTVTHSGATTLSGALTYGGVTLSNAVTGTGNMVLSASPTLTGTLTGAAANFSGVVTFAGSTQVGSAGALGVGAAATASSSFTVNCGITNKIEVMTAGTYNCISLNGVNSGINTMSGIFGGSTGDVGALYIEAPTSISGRIGSSIITTTNASGLGIGMTPSNVLDITQSQNAASIGRIFNGTSGTAGSAEWRASNDVNDSIRLISINQSYTTSGLFVARKSVIASDGVGLAITTMSAQAMQFGINNTEVARFDSSGRLQVGTTAGTGRINMANAGGGLQQINSTGGTQEILNLFSDNNLYFSAPSNIIIRPGGGGERVRITTDGLGIGGTPPSGVPFYVSSGGAYAYLNSTTGGYSSVTGFDNGTQRWSIGQSAFGGANGLQFFSGTTEAARINSNSFLVGKTASAIATAGFQANFGTGQTDVTVSGSECMNLARLSSYGAIMRFFQTDGATICGSISTSAGATAYNTSSDYRLKENVQPMTGGLDTIAALKPVTYDWIADQTTGEGFIAHELQAVIPRAVTGEKDALDKDGKMDPQGVDFSKIVPHLVAAIQELTARLAALEAK